MELECNDLRGCGNAGLTAIRGAIHRRSVLPLYIFAALTQGRAVLGVLHGQDFVAAVDPAERGHVALDDRPHRRHRRRRRRGRARLRAAGARNGAAAVGEEGARRRRLRSPAAARGAAWVKIRINSFKGYQAVESNRNN